VVAAEAVAHQRWSRATTTMTTAWKPPSGAGSTILNPDSKRVITAYVEPSLGGADAGESFQFERHGYFVADLLQHAPGKPVYNRTVTLKDSWAQR
jgi:glutamyl/glutaminyl-tRNA synthetase